MTHTITRPLVSQTAPRTFSSGALPRRRIHIRRSRWSRVLLPLSLGAVVVLAWHLVSTTGWVPQLLLPAPADVVQRIVDELVSGRMWPYLSTTLSAALLGSALGMAVAVPLGYLTARSSLAALAVQPYVAASQAMPAVAVAPLLVLWVGYGMLPVVLLCALMVFFPMFMGTMVGLQRIDTDLLDAARLDGAGRWPLLRHIEAALALPTLLAGVRHALTLSITGAVVGEFVTGGSGMGLLLSIQAGSADSTGLFATITVLMAMAASLYLAVRALESRTWYERTATDDRPLSKETR